MLGLDIHNVVVQPIDMEYVACKIPKFSFSRLRNSDPRLGVEMQSTGEVACFGVNHYEAFLKGMIAAGFRIPAKNILISIGPSQQKFEFMQYARLLVEMGYQLYATKNTQQVLIDGGLTGCIPVFMPQVRREPNVVTLLLGGKLDLVINVPDSMDSMAATEGFQLRRATIDSDTPLIMDVKVAVATTLALHRKWDRERNGRAFWSYNSWQEYTGMADVVAGTDR